MKKSFLTLSIIFLMLTSISAKTAVTSNSYKIVPFPQQLIPSKGSFTINKNTVVVIDKNNKEEVLNANYFVEQLKNSTGISLQIAYKAQKKSGVIRFKTNKNIAKEGYALKITTKTIDVEASTATGCFYAIQTMFQLMPAQIYSNDLIPIAKINIPCADINDEPRFQYRGVHLDVGRHFFPVSFLKKYIDALAIHKINNFHWHLTEDQGWRIEIKKYPKLTEIGSVRERTLIGHYREFTPQRFDSIPYGGFYTQQQAREIVAYAAARHINVIPEIEIPGHAMAALAAYPELSCRQKPIKVADKWGIFEDVFCTRDTVFHFLENVLTEIVDIFPSQYIHIGGDECPKARWKECPDCQARIKELGLTNEHELQSYFIQRMEKFLNSKGRKIIGWDEILEGGLAPNATVMSWRGTKGGIQAAKEHHDVIMTPGTHCYFDHYQFNPEFEPTAIGGYTPLNKVYEYEPIPQELTADERKYILGTQANVWSEYLATEKKVEYMAFPRVSAISEVQWTQPENKNLNRFMSYIPTEFERYKALKIQPAEVYYNIGYQAKSIGVDSLEISLSTDNTSGEIYYSLDGSTPDQKAKKYSEPIIITTKTIVKAQAFEKNKEIGNPFLKEFLAGKVTGK